MLANPLVVSEGMIHETLDQWVANALTISGWRSSTVEAPKSLIAVVISRFNIWMILTTPSAPYAWGKFDSA